MTIYDKMTIGGSTVSDAFDIQVRRSIGEMNKSSNFSATIDNLDGKNSGNYIVGDEVKIYADKDNLILPTTNPIAHWKLNDNLATTNVIDSIGSNNGTLIDVGGNPNTNAHHVTGKIGGALDFEGGYEIADYNHIDCGDDSSLNLTTNLSISCWIKPDILQEDVTNRGVAGKVEKYNDSGNWSWQLRYGSPDDNQLGFQANDDGGSGIWVTAKQNLTTGVWYHITITIDNHNLKFYVNGAETDSNTMIGNITSNLNKLMIGTEGWANCFDGSIDDFRIYDKTLTSTEISSIYNSGSGTEDNIADQKIFAGLLETKRFPSREIKQQLLIKGRDYTARLMDRTVEPEVYTTLPAGSIVKDIIAKYTDDITVTNVDDSSTTVSRIAFSHTPVFDAVKKLAELSNYTFYVDENKDLHFKEKSINSSGKTFNNTNVIRANFIEKRDTVFNEIWVYGDRYLDSIKEEFTADGAGSLFTLTYKPHNTQVDVGSPITAFTRQKGGIANMNIIPTSGVDYLVNYDDQAISFTSGTSIGYDALPASGTLITIDYSRSLPIVKVGRDNNSIKKYGKRIKKIIDKEIKDPDTAQERLAVELALTNEPKKEGTLNVHGLIDVTPSQTAIVNLPQQGITNKTYDVLEVQYDFNKTKNETENVLILQVNKKLDNITDTIKNLINDVRIIQAQDIDSSDILSRFEFTTGSITIKQSGCAVSQRSIAGDALIWGSTDFGIWGTGKWGDTANISFVLGNTSAAILGTSKLGTQVSLWNKTWSGCYY